MAACPVWSNGKSIAGMNIITLVMISRKGIELELVGNFPVERLFFRQNMLLQQNWTFPGKAHAESDSKHSLSQGRIFSLRKEQERDWFFHFYFYKSCSWLCGLEIVSWFITCINCKEDKQLKVESMENRSSHFSVSEIWGQLQNTLYRNSNLYTPTHLLYINHSATGYCKVAEDFSSRSSCYNKRNI